MTHSRPCRDRSNRLGGCALLFCTVFQPEDHRRVQLTLTPVPLERRGRQVDSREALVEEEKAVLNEKLRLLHHLIGERGRAAVNEAVPGSRRARRTDMLNLQVHHREDTGSFTTAGM